MINRIRVWRQTLGTILDSTTTSNVLALAGIGLTIYLTAVGVDGISKFSRWLVIFIILITTAVVVNQFIRTLRKHISQRFDRLIDLSVTKIFERIAELGSHQWHYFYVEHLWKINNISGEDAIYEKCIRGYCSTAGASTFEESYITNGAMPNKEDCSFSGGEIIDIREIELVDGVRKFKIVVLLKKTYRYGEQFEFKITRHIKNGFISKNEWISTKIYPAMHGIIILRVRFPVGMPLIAESIKLSRYAGDTEDPVSSESLDLRYATNETGRAVPEIVAEVGDFKPGEIYKIRWVSQ